MTHEAKVKPGSHTSTGQGIAFSTICCDYEETWHIEHAGMLSKEEMQRKIDDAVVKTRERHENHCAALEIFDMLAKANQ